MEKFTKKQFNIEGGLPKKRGLGQFADLEGEGGRAALARKLKEGEGVFLSGELIPQCTLFIIWY